MKIWMQSFNWYPHELGGAERSARALACGLARAGHTVRIVLSDGVPGYPERIDGLPVQVIEGSRLGTSPLAAGKRSFVSRALWNLRGEIDPALALRWRHALAHDRPDVVIFNNPAGHGALALAACRLADVPTVAVLRDYGWVCAHGTMMRGDRPCEGLCGRCRATLTWRRTELSKTTRVVAISQTMADLAQNLAGVPDPIIVPPALPDAVFDTPRPARAPGPLRVGYLGRLHPSKGVNVLIDAWFRMRNRQDAQLLLAGPDQGIELRADAQACGIKYLGPVSDPVRFLDNIDLLVLPGLWAEPFGRTVIEARARGCALIVTDRGAPPTLLSSLDTRQRVVPAGDVTALAQALEEAISSSDTILSHDVVRDLGPDLPHYREAAILAQWQGILAGMTA